MGSGADAEAAGGSLGITFGWDETRQPQSVATAASQVPASSAEQQDGVEAEGDGVMQIQDALLLGLIVEAA